VKCQVRDLGGDAGPIVEQDREVGGGYLPVGVPDLRVPLEVGDCGRQSRGFSEQPVVGRDHVDGPVVQSEVSDELVRVKRAPCSPCHPDRSPFQSG
jgi:hypothetical protein